MQSYNPAIPRCTFSRLYSMVAKHVNKEKWWQKQVFWGLMLFYTHMLLLLHPSVLWFSIVTFNNDKHHRPSQFCANLMYHYSDPG